MELTPLGQNFPRFPSNPYNHFTEDEVRRVLHYFDITRLEPDDKQPR